MASENLFIFTAGHPDARAHLDDSIRRPINLEAIIDCFSEEDANRVRKIDSEHGLYAWGAVPGPNNEKNWEQMNRGDWVLTVYGNKYRFVSQVVDKFENIEAAEAVWGADDQGHTWQFMYFLTKPEPLNVSVPDFSDFLSRQYRGFTKISESKVEKIERFFGSLDRFLKVELMTNRGGEGAKREIPEGITREDVLKAIKLFDTGIDHGFGPSSTYDLIHKDRQYPPKAIIGLAAMRVIGRPLQHQEFEGGEETEAFRILRELGFEIRRKKDIQKKPEKELYLFGTNRKAEEEFTHVQDYIKANGGWAHWWSFVIPEDLQLNLDTPFWLYMNKGQGVFPVRILIDDFSSQAGSEGHISPWPEITESDWRDKARLGPKQNEIFKTWFRSTQIERLEPPVTIADFVPAEPWSNEKNWLNQNAFGFAYLRSEKDNIMPVPFSSEDALKTLFMNEKEFNAVQAGLKRKKNVILQGPPGVGKTFAARLVAYALMGEKNPKQIEMVQFHQSYAYEDFVQGWRPKESGGFELRNGVFYEFCERAKQEPERKFVFIIDEINRGNLSKILGELMMLIEADKRGKSYSMPLTYSSSDDKRFFVPDNVYLIGLMNTADRSLAMVDYALRRRFLFFDMWPQFESPKFREALVEQGVSSELIDLIVERMGMVNGEIVDNLHLGAGFQIGHSYFCSSLPVDIDQTWYQSVIESEIAPLLHEYWFDQQEQAESLIEELLA